MTFLNCFLKNVPNIIVIGLENKVDGTINLQARGLTL